MGQPPLSSNLTWFSCFWRVVFTVSEIDECQSNPCGPNGDCNNCKYLNNYSKQRPDFKSNIPSKQDLMEFWCHPRVKKYQEPTKQSTMRKGGMECFQLKAFFVLWGKQDYPLHSCSLPSPTFSQTFNNKIKSVSVSEPRILDCSRLFMNWRKARNRRCSRKLGKSRGRKRNYSECNAVLFFLSICSCQFLYVFVPPWLHRNQLRPG